MTDLDLENLVLERGKHHSPEQGFNVLEAVSRMNRERFTDKPKLVSPVIGAFLREFNDALDDDTRQKLKDYVPRIYKSLLSDDVEDFRAWVATDWLVRVQAPMWLKAAGMEELAEPLESSSPVHDPDTAREIQDALDKAAEATRAAADEGTNAWNEKGEEAWATVTPDQWNAAGSGVQLAVKKAAARVIKPAYEAAGAVARSAARDANAEIASDVAWDAAWSIAWKAALEVGGEVRGEAGDAAREALAPTVDAVTKEIFGLLDKLLETRRKTTETAGMHEDVRGAAR
ncbi:MAG TPA: hypothetical protein VHJ40_06115 [Actinomycetota bacterium]|nr:hypothetical protein [Actinomycetota bacterium]